MAQNKENTASNSIKSTEAHSSETNNSLVAFLGAIKFRKPTHAANDVERYFAQPQPQARQRRKLAEENYWIRSAN
ncbi:hypothetical protein N9H37_02580 [Congregibacter sp.]|nr:hypothetical protein [Congregibacter sp.]MDA8962218.1 hypothetical protein [Congregibacter sp.]